MDIIKKELTEDKVIYQMQEWLTDCDADDMAYFVGLIFGGDCEYNLATENYDFTPNQDYMGAFD